MHKQRNHTTTVLALSAIALGLTACASAPKSNAALDAARSAYQGAASDANVVRSAPLELRRANEALGRAEAALREGSDMPLVNHYAELARKRTEIARLTAATAATEAEVAQAGKQRDDILLNSRTQEAESQRAKAEAARQTADQARMQADAARKSAEDRLAMSQKAQADAAAARERAKALEMQLADMKAKQTERGMVLTLGDVLFDTGRAELKPGAFRTLDQLTQFLKENPERSLQIEGYTDSVGSDASNQVLSERRAIAVKNALIDRGVAANRVSARGYGESKPVASNDDAAGRQQNRRVEIVISEAKS